MARFLRTFGQAGRVSHSHSAVARPRAKASPAGFGGGGESLRGTQVYHRLRISCRLEERLRPAIRIAIRASSRYHVQ